jgi:hypothetical protein
MKGTHLKRYARSSLILVSSMHYFLSMKYFKSLLCFLFIAVMIVNCKNKEQDPLPTIDETNYDDKNHQSEEEETSLSEQNRGDTSDNNESELNSLEKIQDKEITYPVEYRENSMTGHFIYFADAAVFTPCGKTKPIPVQMGTQEYLKLEKAYSNTVEGGIPCFVEFLGKIRKLPSYDGGKKVDMIVVEKLIEVQYFRECS